ncbi:MAG: 4-(cytidine 5'-diphospho)-2-C-methyl-D-erythritol kinase [Cyclobacteriaceae bacterium]|nr:4-(cytidine 5'-diphospho)-2-C-methyl-D-erythritol kinase [Cyclobacteriaceae bacterium]
MITFPPAKINLGLRVISKRNDGYHNIESVLYPVPLTDILEIVPSEEFNLTVSGDYSAGGDHWENTCVKAYNLLQQRYRLPPVHILLHKLIPVGAGLGGGSSDATSVLLMLDEMFLLGMTIDELKGLAEKIGSDCPFFVQSKASLATGTGTILEEYPVSLAGWHLLLIKPDFNISTREAYQNIRPDSGSAGTIKDILKTPVKEWKDSLKNDFEDSLFPLYPALKTIKDSLYHQGAVYASMSGSGSTVYGLFENRLIHFEFGEQGKYWWLSL